MNEPTRAAPSPALPPAAAASPPAPTPAPLATGAAPGPFRNRVTVFFFHPFPRRSRASVALRRAIEGCPGVKLRDVYEMYPDFGIDVDAEQAALVRTDVAVFQHPLYWYSAPALMKEWLDVVLAHGWAFGPGGAALEGKGWLQALTAAGAEESYGRAGPHRFTLEELLRPFEQTARHCGMRPLRPFVVHDSHALDEAALEAATLRYRTLLEEARDGRPPPALELA